MQRLGNRALQLAQTMRAIYKQQGGLEGIRRDGGVLQRGACHLKLGHHTASQGSGSAVPWHDGKHTRSMYSRKGMIITAQDSQGCQGRYRRAPSSRPQRRLSAERVRRGYVSDVNRTRRRIQREWGAEGRGGASGIT